MSGHCSLVTNRTVKAISHFFPAQQYYIIVKVVENDSPLKVIERISFCRYVAPRARSASSGQGENEHRIMALFFFLLLLISHREQLLRLQGDRIFLRLREIGQAGGYPRLTSL